VHASILHSAIYYDLQCKYRSNWQLCEKKWSNIGYKKNVQKMNIVSDGLSMGALAL